MTNITPRVKKPKKQLTPELVDEYELIVAEIKRLDDRKQELRTVIVGSLEPGSYNAGSCTIDVAETRTLDKKTFSKDFPPADFPELYEMTPSTGAVKEAFSKSDREEYFTKNLRLTVKRIKKED